MGDADLRKRAAAAEAVLEVRPGQRLGLGTGSTITHFLELLAERVQNGEVSGIVGVPTSLQTERHAHALGVPMSSLDELQPLDLTVDGADEIDPNLDLIKGLGGALVREKMVAEASKRVVIIGDASKSVPRLGSKAPLPVEVVEFEWKCHLPFLEQLGAEPVLRTNSDGSPYRTDNGNVILDCHFAAGISEPRTVETALDGRAGIVGSGLFLGIADHAYVANGDGVEQRSRAELDSSGQESGTGLSDAAGETR